MTLWENVLTRQIDHSVAGLQQVLSDCWAPSRMELQEVGLAHRIPQCPDELTRAYFPVWREYRGIPKTMVRLFSRFVLPWYYRVLMMIDLRHLKDVIGWAHSHEHQREDSALTL